MIIELMDQDLTVCKVRDFKDIDTSAGFFFTAVTDEEISLVCATGDVPEETTDREDGWRAFHIAGPLDFSLIGILSRISSILAEREIGLFAVSTYDTDYILVKEEQLDRALGALLENGYEIRG